MDRRSLCHLALCAGTSTNSFACSSPEPRHRTRQAPRRSLRSKRLIGRADMTPITILHCLAIRQKVCPIFANVSHTNLCFCLQAVKSSLRKGTRLERCQKRWQPPRHRRKDPPAVSCARAYRRVPIYCARALTCRGGPAVSRARTHTAVS